jgi:ketosteroid isomerase-like protein
MRKNLCVRLAGVVAWGLALTFPVAGAEPVRHGPNAAAASIVAADRAFARESVASGLARAFRDYLDPADGKEFPDHGAPISGNAVFAKHSKDKGTLDWSPSEVFAAQSGDMGVTWGRWTYTAPGHATERGRYVTVWRKDTTGAWKAIIDIGNSDR